MKHEDVGRRNGSLVGNAGESNIRRGQKCESVRERTFQLEMSLLETLSSVARNLARCIAIPLYMSRHQSRKRHLEGS